MNFSTTALGTGQRHGQYTGLPAIGGWRVGLLVAARVHGQAWVGVCTGICMVAMSALSWITWGCCATRVRMETETEI